MKLITRDTDYAIRALCFIAKSKNDKVSARELVKALRVPKAFLRKILQILNKKGVLKSYKGQGGGFKLALPATRIFLLNLMKIFQGPLELNQCTFKRVVCRDVKFCLVKKKIDNIQRLVTQELHNISIAALVEKGG